MNQASANWIDLRRDAVSGIEALRAHFTGHAWDPHWHDSYLIGVTEQGVQQFHSRRKQHQSRPGTVFMLEPEELHDGDAINHSGFTYRMLYLSPQQIAQQLTPNQADDPLPRELRFATTLRDDRPLAYAVWHAFDALWYNHPAIIKEAAMDRMFSQLTSHRQWSLPAQPVDKDARLALQARDWLIAHHAEIPACCRWRSSCRWIASGYHACSRLTGVCRLTPGWCNGGCWALPSSAIKKTCVS